MNNTKKIFKILRKEKFILTTILLLSVLIRLYFAFTHERLFAGDQRAYDKLAVSLWQRHEFAWEEGRPTAYVTPLYPVFLSGIYALFGYSHLWAKVFQALLGSLTCLIMYFIAREIFGKAVALLTIFLMSVHHFFISYGILLNSENLFIFLVALNVLSLIKFCKRPSYLCALFFGISAALASFTRSAYFLFPFMAIACLYFMLNRLDITKGKLTALALCIIACVILPMSMWTIRNYLVFKAFVPVGTEAGIVLYSSYNPMNGKFFDKCTQDEVTWKYPEFSKVEGSRFLLKQTLLSIKKDPAKLYKYIPLRLMYFFSVFDWLAFKEGTGIYNFSTAFILPLAFIGIILAFLKKSFRFDSLIILLPVIYFVLITIAIMGVPRTRLPVEPYLIIFAAFFINHIYSRSRSKMTVTCSIFGWYLFNFLLYLESEKVKIIARTFFERLGLW